MTRRPLLGALAIIIVAVTLLPVPILVWMSFFDQSFLAVPPTNGYTFQWFLELPQNGPLFNGLIYSLGIAASAAVIATVIGMAAAFGSVRGRFKDTGLVDSVLTLPLTVPNIVLSMALYVFLFQVGSAIGLPLTGNIGSLLIAHVIITIPWTYRISVAGVAGLSRDLERSSADLGANGWTTLVHVTIPVLKPAVFASALLAFVHSFSTLEVSLFLTTPRMNTLPVAMMQYAEQTMDPALAAMAVVQMLLTTIILLVIDRVFGLGKTFEGGLKQ